MKKILLLLCTLLGTVGAMATEYTVTYSTSTGSYTATNSAGSWASKWVSNNATGPQVTISTGANNIKVEDGAIYSGANGCTYTISVPSGYYITGYEIKGTANTGAQTLTPAAGGLPTEFATTGETTLTVSGIQLQSTSFTHSTPNSGIQLSSFIITILGPSNEQKAAYNTVQGWISTIQGAEGLVTDAANYVSNAKSSAEGSYAALLDGDYTSYFHSAYGSEGPDEDHYLQATLSEAVDAFYFYFKKRSQNNNNRPTSITIYGSNDNTNYTEITTINSGLPTTSDVIDYASSKISLGASYKYIRFTVTITNSGAMSDNNHVFFTFSEFYLLPSNSHVDAAMEFYLGGKQAYEYTDTEVSQVNALDLEIRSATLAPAKANVLAAYAIPDGKIGTVGYPTQTAWDTFVSAINAITVEDDFDTVKNAAVEALMTSAKLAGGVYKIRNFQTGHYLYQDEADAVVTFASTDAIAGNHSYWRITDNGDGTYAILDLYGHQLTKGNQGQGWSAVQNGNHTQVTTITRDYTNDNYKTDGNLASFYLGGAHINTGYNTGSKVFVTDWTTGGLGSNANHWFFEPVEGLIEYTISITGAPVNITMGDGTVLSNGTYTVFLSDANQILAPEVTSYEVSKIVEGNTATITYTVTDYSALITEYLTTERMNNIGGAGKLGYMQNTGEDFTNLMNLLITFQDPAHIYTEADYNNLVTYYEACAANPKLPEAGKFYFVKNVSNQKYISAIGVNRGSVIATAVTPSAATVVKAVERNGHIYLGVQGKEFSWAYTGSYAALMEDNGKYAHFTVTTPGQIAFAHALGDGEGSYAGYLADANYAVNTEGVVVGGKATDTAAQWIFEEATSINVTIGSADYATLYVPFAVGIPEGVTAYTGKIGGNANEKWLTLNPVETTIPAGTPVVLKGDAETYTFNIVDDVAAIENNDLQGIYFAGKPDGALTLQVKDAIGFYTFSGEAIGANKAYLTLPAGVKSLAIRFSDATAIQSIHGTENGAAIYNLAGQRVSNAQKGIFIVGGKKIVK